MDLIEEDILMHYGVKRRSGRYPWGSGDNPYQHGGDFLARVEELQRLGKTEKQIADELHLSTTDLRMQVRVAKHERRALQADRARSLREDGKTLDEIASILGYANDSSVRALLNENTAANKNKAQATAEILKKELAEKGAIDVGTGVERQLGVSTGVLQEALFILETEGYNRYGVGVPQVNDPKKRTITPVISVPEIDQREVYQNLDLVKSVGDYHSTDGGESWDKREYPASIDSSRVKILYGDEGGALKDGVIEIRRGVADLDLGDSHYAQVRILVDGTHYLKGMAMYSDDMPDGADIVFNTNKHTGTPKMDVLKKIQDDPDNPFGALIKANGQSHYIDADGNEKLSAINKLKEEGDWDKMSKNLSSQFLSKQPIQLIKKQLDLTYADAADEFSEICSLNNPTVKRKLLLDFADECDSAAVHLKAAALPRQSTQVILPLNAMKETEIFAPNYRDGEKVVLIRYPHGGTFEIPELTVNNKNPTAVSVLGKNIRDAVGINPKVAERLSGADFDGDQVVVIPTGGRVKIQSTPALTELFDGVGNFINTKEQTLQLEHSLVSLSKWEAKWHKPYLSRKAMTIEETIDYIRCMTLTQNVDPNVYKAITPSNLKTVTEYIDAPMTATTISNAKKKGGSRKIVTAEVIYYWMISYGIPFECQKWHLNRLLTLINVCNVEGSPPQKLSRAEVAAQYKALNAARRKQWNTRG